MFRFVNVFALLVLLALIALPLNSAFTGTSTSPSRSFQGWSTGISTSRTSNRDRSLPVMQLAPVDLNVDLDATSSFLLSAINSENLGEFGKSAIIALVFGGGLIPATFAANKSMLGTLTGKRRGGEDVKGLEGEPYIEDSGASGPPLPLSKLLFASEAIPLADVVAIVGRIKDLNSVADWKNLPSAKLPNTNPDNPPMWLPRATFKKNIRQSKFLGWPVDPQTQEPVGGQDLKNSEEKRIKNGKAEIGDAALDAVFDSFAWGASVATPDKVEPSLKAWRQDAQTFDLGKFTGAAVRGRSITGFAALTFIVIQVVAFGALFFAPTLRMLFDIDIGFGTLGS